MLLVRRAFLASLFFVVSSFTAQAQTTKITFLLVNDIYQMSEELQPDGKVRGGFARLAAIVKAERAKGGHVIFAHGRHAVAFADVEFR